jgi:hypothetical protein
VNRAPAKDQRPRRRLLLAGFGVITGLCALLALLWLGRGLPGWPGELFRMITGLLTTPVFMEVSFLVIGLMIVLGINAWRRRRDGDECVYLEQVVGHPEIPSHARFAIHDEKSTETTEPSPLDRAEGALAIGDHAGATEALAQLDPAALESPAALDLRIRLARATGHNELADILKQKRQGPFSEGSG